MVVVYDACVLYPAPLRDLLIRLASAGLVQAKWTDKILDECFTSIVRERADLVGKLERTRDLMNQAVPDCLVSGYESLIEGLTLPDPNDRHVLAAAIRCRAQLIVTWNSRDFPGDVLARFDVEAQDPDVFVRNLVDMNPGSVVGVLRAQAGDLKRPPQSVSDLLQTLRSGGLVQTAAAIQSFV